MRSRRLPLAVSIGLVASLAIAGIVQAAETTLTATLGPPADEDGSGTASVTLDPETGEACWNLTAEGIGPVLQSHIHVGAEGEEGAVVVPLDTDGFEDASEGCVSDQDAAVLQAVIDDPAGHYVNLHTEEHQGGAIRGQLAAAATPPNTALPVPGSPSAAVGVLMLALALAIALRAWRPLTTRG